jgi:dTMP kinase
MPVRGKFVVIEGIDGSGKRTQIELLASALAERGIDCVRVSFPNYEGFFGKMVAQFLNGEFGALDTVDPHFSALLYAGDRLESKPQIENALADGKIVLADRYIGSNLAHQGSRAPRTKRADFLKWLKHLEYEIYQLPKEDLVVYLRVPSRQAQRLVSKKGTRAYTKRRRDLQESNLAHLEAASQVYDELSKQPNWVRIECSSSTKRNEHGRGASANSTTANLRAPESIHEDVLAAIEARILAPAVSKG